MSNISANAAQETACVCDTLVALSRKLWERQRYLETVRGKPNLEMEMSGAEVVESVAVQLDAVIAELLVALARPPETPQLRRAVNRKLYCV